MYCLQSILWFNIGSVDSFERNLENAQIEMNVEPPNFVPVIYKTELEAASVTGILPTLLIIGKIIRLLERKHHFQSDVCFLGAGRFISLENFLNELDLKWSIQK